MTCQSDLENENQWYYVSISISVAFTLFVVILQSCCLPDQLQGAPGLAAQFYFVIGSLKICFGLCIWLFFQPTCPASCTEQQQQEDYCSTLPLPLYPVIAMAIGMRWLCIGYGRLKVARALARTDIDEDGIHHTDTEIPVFSSLPTKDLD